MFLLLQQGNSLNYFSLLLGFFPRKCIQTDLFTFVGLQFSKEGGFQRVYPDHKSYGKYGKYFEKEVGLNVLDYCSK